METNGTELIEYIAKNLVSEPEQVTVTRRETSTNVVVDLRVAQGDMGRVIGRGGRIANAMRHVLRVADRSDKRLVLNID
jgi:uncharacterized protein